MDLGIALDDELAAAPVRQADADAGILHGAGDALDLGVVVFVLYGKERLHKAGRVIDDLPVRQHTAGTDSVAVADLPRGDADKVGSAVQQRLHGEARLRDAKAAERTGRRIVRIVGIAVDLEVFVGIGTGGVRCRRARAPGRPSEA